MSAPVRVGVTVNGSQYDRLAEPRLLLSDFLRHELGLTGTHVGCEPTLRTRAAGGAWFRGISMK